MGIPYTYLIGWSNLDIWYYGVRFAKDCHPNDLWDIYYTSSKYVKNFRKKYGEPDIIQVRKTFSEEKQATAWESKVLTKIKAVQNEKWLNKTNNSSIPSEFASNRKGCFHSKSSKEKIKKAHVGKVKSKEIKDKISKSKLGVKTPWSENRKEEWKKRCLDYWTTEKREQFKKFGGKNAVKVKYMNVTYSSIKELCENINISRPTAYKWIKQGKVRKI